MPASEFEIQKTYLQLYKMIAELEKDKSAPDWAGDPRAWRIGAEWGLRLAISWLQNNTSVALPEEVKIFQKTEVKL